MRQKRAFALLVLIGFNLLVFSCGKKGTKPTPPGQSTAEGWAKFGSGDYQNAINDFNSAIAADPNYCDAYLGLGWCYAVLSNDSLSVENFQKHLSFPNPDSITSDAKAGLAFAYQAQKECSLAIDKAKEVLSFNSSWKFTHDTTYTASDLHLLLAECYFALSDFESSLAEVQILNPDFNAYVNTPIGRGALADEIERLRKIV